MQFYCLLVQGVACISPNPTLEELPRTRRLMNPAVWLRHCHVRRNAGYLAFSRAIRITRSKSCLCPGLRKNATAPERSAWSSSSLPAWALKKITGILDLISLRRRCSCKPFRFGMRTSRITQEASVASPEFSKSAPEKYASACIPNERMSLQVELATEASSSTTIMSVDSLAFVLEATVMINLEAP